MKKITKIKLINWHIYINETINIKNNAIITGRNGCGKSTFIDAVAFLLGGCAKFNMAANDKSKRTLESYMRGKLGADSKLYLRSEDVITHIAIEFYDDIEDSYFVLGVCLELNNNLSKANRSYYIINNYTLKDDDFISNNNISNYKDFENKLKSKKADLLRIEGGVNRVKTSISKILKFDEKYYELVPKSLAFKPIDEVNRFVYDFLMPEVLVDIEGMRDNFRTYSNLNAILQTEKEKKETLDVLLSKYEQFCDVENKIVLLEVLNMHNRIQRLNSDITKNNLKISELNIEVETINFNDKEINTNLNLTKNNLSLLKNSDEYNLLRSINEDINNADKEITKYGADCSKLKKLIYFEIELAKQFNIKDYFSSYLANKVDFKAFKNNLINYKLELDEKSEAINTKKYKIKESIEQLSQQISELTDKIKQLKSGKRAYSKSLVNLISIIKEGIKDKYNKEIDITPLCELIDLKEQETEWRNALEGYLNTRKFDLFIDEKYYDDAVIIYEKFKRQYNITGIGIVNTQSLREREVLNNSLATKVVSDHKNALKYINYILGDLICVENEVDLKKYDKAINKTVLVYQNKAVRQTNFKAFEVPYIGYNTIKIQLELAHKELEDKETIHKELNENNKTIELASKLISNSKIMVFDTYDEDVLFIYNKAKENLQLLKAEKEDLIKANDLIAIEEKIKNYDEKIISLEGNLETNKILNIEKNSEIRTLSNKNNDNKIEIEDKTEKINSKLISPHHIISFESFRKENTYSEEEYSRLKYKKSRLSYEVLKTMDQYIINFNFDSKSGLEFINEYIDEHNKIVTRNIIKFENQCEDALLSCRHAFETVYIEKIRQSIRQEKDNIKKINKILSDKKFGDNEEIYEFIITKSNDQVFSPYYDIFTSEESFLPSNLLETNLSSKNEELMKELFSKLTLDDSIEKNEKILKQFLDYRNFMSYDIKITDKQDYVSYFSKINKEKSGGETQTPFYVIIGAAFEQTTANKTFKSSSCVVMLDEAFNNMDSSRIKSMMEFYDKLKIQVLILTPPERSAIIRPYVDTAIGLVKVNNEICTFPMETVNDKCLK